MPPVRSRSVMAWRHRNEAKALPPKPLADWSVRRGRTRGSRSSSRARTRTMSPPRVCCAELGSGRLIRTATSYAGRSLANYLPPPCGEGWGRNLFRFGEGRVGGLATLELRVGAEAALKAESSFISESL